MIAKLPGKRRLTDEARQSCEQYRWQSVRAQWLSLYESMVGPQRAVPEPTASAI
jgi:hypothetical protein